MQINDIFINASCSDILTELQTQMRLNNLPYISKMKPSHNSIQICCPYHKGGAEHKPSAGVRISDGLFHCFTCGEIHTLPEVISYCFGHDDLGIFGMSWIMRNFGTIAKEERKPLNLNYSRNSTASQPKNIEYITEQELQEYRWIHPYMYKRGLTDNIIELFDIGYDEKTKCITFPVRDMHGNCLFVARRSVQTKFFNYPEGVEKPLYGLYELYQQAELPKELIICESMLDALSCWVYGKYAVALNGLGNELQFKQLKSLPCRKLILATDNDDAGIRARTRIKKNVGNSKIIKQYVIPHIERPDGKVTKDINDLTLDEFKNLQEIF